MREGNKPATIKPTPIGIEKSRPAMDGGIVSVTISAVGDDPELDTRRQFALKIREACQAMAGPRVALPIATCCGYLWVVRASG